MSLSSQRVKGQCLVLIRTSNTKHPVCSSHVIHPPRPATNCSFNHYSLTILIIKIIKKKCSFIFLKGKFKKLESWITNSKNGHTPNRKEKKKKHAQVASTELKQTCRTVHAVLLFHDVYSIPRHILLDQSYYYAMMIKGKVRGIDFILTNKNK